MYHNANRKGWNWARGMLPYMLPSTLQNAGHNTSINRMGLSASERSATGY